MNHIFSVSSFGFILVAVTYIEAPEERIILIFLGPLFLGFFFVGVLIYGLFGVAIRGFVVTRLIMQNVDLNDNSAKDEIKIFVLFSGEVVVAIIFFLIVALIVPEAINFQLIFQVIVSKFGQPG